MLFPQPGGPTTKATQAWYTWGLSRKSWRERFASLCPTIPAAVPGYTSLQNHGAGRGAGECTIGAATGIKGGSSFAPTGTAAGSSLRSPLPGSSTAAPPYSDRVSGSVEGCLASPGSSAMGAGGRAGPSPSRPYNRAITEFTQGFLRGGPREYSRGRGFFPSTGRTIGTLGAAYKRSINPVEPLMLHNSRLATGKWEIYCSRCPVGAKLRPKGADFFKGPRFRRTFPGRSGPRERLARAAGCLPQEQAGFC